MAIAIPALQFLLAARAAGVSFTRSGTIGRQSFCVPEPDFRRLVAAFGVGDEPAGDFERCQEAPEALLTLLGASSVESLDASAYEGASLVHDLNEPVPADLHDRFSALIDGGTMEHVYDVAQVMRNYRDMVAPHGHLLLITVANNQCGHGFYQFSPDFFYRSLDAARGFEVATVLLCELRERGSRHDWDSRRPRFYSVDDPCHTDALRHVSNDHPTYIMVVARKLETADLAARTPQQSFYAHHAWTAPASPGRKERPQRTHRRRGLKRQLRDLALRRGWFKARLEGLHQGGFQRLTLAQMVQGDLAGKGWRGPCR